MSRVTSWHQDKEKFEAMIQIHGSPTRAARVEGGISERRAREIWNQIQSGVAPAKRSEPAPIVDSVPANDARVLYVDIETSPNIADVWGLWNQNVGLTQLRESSRIIGFGAKWRGAKRVQWYSEYNRETGELSEHEAMLQAAYDLYEEADVVVTYNGDRFDHLHFNAEWVTAGMTPPSPVKSIDLYKTVKKNFRFPSNKLAYVADRLIGDTKVSNGGHLLWRHCLDPEVDAETRRKAWNMMARYCRQDVALMEPLHDKLEPWLPATVNMALIGGSPEGCTKCGGCSLEKRGIAYTASRAYQQFRCRDCGGWLRGTLHKSAKTALA